MEEEMTKAGNDEIIVQPPLSPEKEDCCRFCPIVDPKPGGNCLVCLSAKKE